MLVFVGVGPWGGWVGIPSKICRGWAEQNESASRFQASERILRASLPERSGLRTSSQSSPPSTLPPLPSSSFDHPPPSRPRKPSCCAPPSRVLGGASSSSSSLIYCLSKIARVVHRRLFPRQKQARPTSRRAYGWRSQRRASLLRAASLSE